MWRRFVVDSHIGSRARNSKFSESFAASRIRNPRRRFALILLQPITPPARRLTMATTIATSENELSRVPSTSSSTYPPLATPSTLAGPDQGPLEQASSELIPPTGAKRFEALDNYPDGGLEAWLQVLCCSACLTVCVGGIYSWGVMQDALSKQGNVKSSSTSWIGSVQAASTALLAIPTNRLVSAYGPRKMALIGSLVTGLGPLLGSFCTHSFIGLLVTVGLIFGVGQTLCFFPAATLPSSYFLKRRGVATGIVYSGGGVGGAAFSLLSSVLIEKVGIPWTLRITALLYFAILFPSAYFLKARLPRKPLRGGGPVVDWSMFRDPRFVLMFFGGSIALFPLFGELTALRSTFVAFSQIATTAKVQFYTLTLATSWIDPAVPPFFLPLYASSLELSSLTGSLLLAGFNLSSAVGRIGFGLFADRLFGSLNSMIICLATFSLTTFIIWPFATTLAPLALFAIVNGAVAGGFFSLTPGVIGSLFGTATLPVTFGMVLSAWTPGYALGAPIAGYILAAAQSAGETGYAAFRPAIFYSGSLAMLSCGLLTAARMIESRDLRKRV